MSGDKQQKKSLGLRGKILVSLVIMGLVSCTAYSAFVYRRDYNAAINAARTDAANLLERSTEMFIVSTRRFHDDFQKTATNPEERKRILDDWSRTIFAVDEAVVADHGENKPRARLIGDADIFGYRPLGAESTAIQTEFERESSKRIAAGESAVEEMSDGVLRMAVPLPSLAHAGCAECHFATVEGDQADMNRNIVLGTLNAYVPMGDRLAAAKSNTMTTAGFVCVIFALTIGVLFAVIQRCVISPIRGTVATLKDIAEGEGDLTKRLEIKSNDELGELATWFNRFVGKIQNIITDLAGTSRDVTGASTQLSATASQLASGAEETTHQSTTVASAAEEMSSNMHNMAAATEQMTSNVRTVASATEEMTASISEIAQNAEHASSVAGTAAELAESSNQTIGELGTAADEIGKVIEVIQDIAEQTNLLALNATIEAARAGDAGKGFAVVATEVKELAKQTGEATEDIRHRIEGIQNSSTQAVDSIGRISEVVQQVNEVSQTIASAVEEQSVTTKETASNIAQTTAAAETVSSGVAQSAAASQEITHTIAGVDQAANQTSQGAAQTQQAGTSLESMAERLDSLVSQFKV